MYVWDCKSKLITDNMLYIVYWGDNNIRVCMLV